jgi:hypothetical protein
MGGGGVISGNCTRSQAAQAFGPMEGGPMFVLLFDGDDQEMRGYMTEDGHQYPISKKVNTWNLLFPPHHSIYRCKNVVAVDLSNKSELARVEQILRPHANISLFVNNAGIAISGELVDTDPDRLEESTRLRGCARSLVIGIRCSEPDPGGCSDQRC